MLAEVDAEVEQAGEAWEEDMVTGVDTAMEGHMEVTTPMDTATGVMDHMVVATDTEEWPGVRHLEVASTTALQGAEVLKEANGRSPIKGFYRKNRGSIIAYIFLS